MTVENVLKDLEENDNGNGDAGASSTVSSDDNSSADDKGKIIDKNTGADSDDGDSDSTGDDAGTDKKSDSDDDTDDPIEQLRQTQDELRQMLRIARRENATMKAKLDRLSGKQPKDKSSDEFDDDDTNDDDDTGNGKLSNIEQLQQQLQTIHDVKGASFELLAEQMAETQKYADVAEVCSRQNMDDILEAAATALHEQTGTDFNELVLELEANIWSRPNPYKYLYNLVKEYHPKYQKAGATSDKNDVTGKKTASSIQDMGGAGTKGGGGWTSEKIDAMPEDELHKVPEDIYDKYLAGELD
jgi:hypothetical protein